jgi:hypothetical protein
MNEKLKLKTTIRSKENWRQQVLATTSREKAGAYFEFWSH